MNGQLVSSDREPNNAGSADQSMITDSAAENQGYLQTFLGDEWRIHKGLSRHTRMDTRHKYSEANSMVQRAQPEPESTLDLDNDDEDKLVIVEDPREETSNSAIGISADTSAVSSVPEQSKKFRGPKKKFLEAFCRSESIASESDSTSGPLGHPVKSGAVEVDSSFDKEDSNLMPVPDSNESDIKACDSTKEDDDSNEAKKKDVPMFNLRSCIDLIIDSRLIRDRLNTSSDVLNEQYNIKVSLSRINEGKTVRDLAKSSKNCTILRNVLHQTQPDQIDSERNVTVSPQDCNSPSASSALGGTPTVIHGDHEIVRIDQHEAIDVRSSKMPGPVKSSLPEISVPQHDIHNPLHQIAALASQIPKEPIAMATEADKIITQRSIAHSPASLSKPAPHTLPSESQVSPGPSKKPMPPLIDTRLTSAPIIDVDNYNSGHAYKSRPWSGNSEAVSRTRDHSEVYGKQGQYTASMPTPRQHEYYPGLSGAPEPTSRMATMPSPRERSWSSGSSYGYPTSGGQLLPPTTRSVSADQPSPGMSSNAWGAPQAHSYRQGASRAEQRSPHSAYLPQYNSPIGGGGKPPNNPSISPQSQTHRPTSSPQLGGNYAHASRGQSHYSEQGWSESPGYPTKVSDAPAIPSPQLDGRRDRSEAGYQTPMHPQSRSHSSVGSLGPPPKLLYVPNATATTSSQSQVAQSLGEPPQYARPHGRSASTTQPAAHWGRSYPPKPVPLSEYPTPSRSITTGQVQSKPQSTREAPLDLTVRSRPAPAPAVSHIPAVQDKDYHHLNKPSREEAPLDLTMRRPLEPALSPTVSHFGSRRLDMYSMSPEYGQRQQGSPSDQLSPGQRHAAFSKIPPNMFGIIQPPGYTPAAKSPHQPRVPVPQHNTQPQASTEPLALAPPIERRAPLDSVLQRNLSLPAVGQERPSISRGVINPDIEKQQTQAMSQQALQLPPHYQQQDQQQHMMMQQSPRHHLLQQPQHHQPQHQQPQHQQPQNLQPQQQQQHQQHNQQPQQQPQHQQPQPQQPQHQQQQQQQPQYQQPQQQPAAMGRGQMKLSTTAQLLGNHPPHDILYLKCNVCTSTYGSLHSFRKHFWKVHGYGPTNEHVTVRSISATRGSASKTEKAMDEIEKPVPAEVLQSQPPPTSVSEKPPSNCSLSNEYDQPFDMVRMDVQRPCTLGEMHHKMAPLSEASTPGSPNDSKTSSPNLKADGNQSTMRCLQCGQDFPTRDWGVFRRHVRAHEQPTLRCSLCRQTFASTRDLQEHNRTYHQDQMWICRVCGVGFVNPGDLGKHMKLVHPGDCSTEDEYKCQLCPLVFDDLQMLLNHLAEHKDQPELASRYAELLVPGSSVRRASPDSTNDMEQKPELVTESKPSPGMIKQELPATSAATVDTKPEEKPLSAQNITSVATVESSGKQSTILTLPKKALYDFIKDKVEYEARKQLGGLHSKENIGSESPSKPSPPPSFARLISNTEIRTTSEPELEKTPTLQETQENSQSSAKPLGETARNTAEPSKATAQNVSDRPFKTMRDALHMLVERAIGNDSQQTSNESNNSKTEENINKNASAPKTDPPSDDSVTKTDSIHQSSTTVEPPAVNTPKLEMPSSEQTKNHSVDSPSMATNTQESQNSVHTPKGADYETEQKSEGSIETPILEAQNNAQCTNEQKSEDLLKKDESSLAPEVPKDSNTVHVSSKDNTSVQLVGSQDKDLEPGEDGGNQKRSRSPEVSAVESDISAPTPEKRPKLDESSPK